MPRIFMKEFSGIAISSGTKKITKIRQEKNKPAYHPSQDYYKQIREAIISAHAKNLGVSHVSKTADECANLKRKVNYQLIARKYIEWLGQKKAKWFKPPRGEFKASSSEIVLNPELGLKYNAKLHVIKLYLAEEPVSQNRANYMIYLMQQDLPEGHEYHVLDIRRKKLFNASGNSETYKISILSEIAGLEAAWESI